MQKGTTRIWFYDNMKAILMFFVVFGHVIERWGNIAFLYKFIYLFHMPLFAFCSGYLAKNNPKKVLTDMVYPYVTFQILYYAFDKWVLGEETAISFSRPNWIMWYMLAIIAWSLLLPLIEVGMTSKKGMIITVGISIALGIVVGFDEKVGYFLSTSRIFYFLPFFVVGFCIKKALKPEVFLNAMSKWYVKCSSGVLTTAILVWFYFLHDKVAVYWLYGSYSYAEGGYHFTTRVLIYLCTFVISIFAISIIPRKETAISYVGQRCIQVYLLHGFIIKLMVKYKVPNVENLKSGVLITLAAAISFVIVFILSSKIVERVFGTLFSLSVAKQK